MLGWSNLALCQRSTWNCVDEQESGVLASARHLLGRKLTRDEKELSRLNRDGWHVSLLSSQRGADQKKSLIDRCPRTGIARS